MVGLTALWLPVLLSAVIVFIASSIVHMVLGYHKTDYDVLPGEAGLMEAMRKQGVGPGNYHIPHVRSHKELQNSDVCKKFEQGPVGLFNVIPSGKPAMGKYLMRWFVYTVVLGVFVAYLTGRTLSAGTEYLQVFRVAGTAAFLGYSGAEPVASIWKGQKWSTTVKHVFDGLLYALLTGGVFGWLWPR